MKKVALLWYFFTSLAFAGDDLEMEMASPIFTGPYVGVGIGYAHQNIEYEYEQMRAENLYNPVFSDQYSAHQNNYVDRGVLGYGLALDLLYFGTEFSIGKLHGKTRSLPLTSGGVSLVRVEQKEDLSLSLLLGGFLTKKTLLYGQAGIGNAKYELLVYDFNDLVFPPQLEQKNSTPQWVFGGGLEQAVWENLTLRLSYVYEKGQRIIGQTAATASNSDFPAAYIINLHRQTFYPFNHAVMLDVVWRFDVDFMKNRA